MQLGKILAAGAMGLLMAGSTIAFASTLADYPQPFVTASGAADFLVVVGASAMPQDVVGAIDVATRLGSETFTSYSCPGSSATSTVTGEGATLSTTTTKIYKGYTINTAKQVLSAADLPTALKSGSVMADDGTEYKYDQYVKLGSTQVTYGTSSQSMDPVMHLDIGTSEEAPLYTLQIIFSTDLDINSTSKSLGKAIKLFDTDFTITSSSAEASNSTLTLYGGGESQTISTGETKDITVGTKTFTVENLLVESTTRASATINGVPRTLIEGSTVTVDGVSIYVKDVLLAQAPQYIGQVTLSFGSDKFKLSSGSAVKQGTDETPVRGTMVNIVPSGQDTISMIEINVTAEDSENDYLAVGGKFKDPVFSSVRVAYGSVTPPLDFAGRDKVEFGVSGEKKATVRFTNSKGETGTIDFAYDVDPQDDGNNPLLQAYPGYNYTIVEGKPVAKNHYVILDAGGFPHLMQVTDNEADGTATAYITLKDIFSNNLYQVTVGATGQRTKVIDGQTYHIAASKASNQVNITWGGGAGFNNPGNEITVYPQLMTMGMADLALVSNVTGLSAGATVILPGGATRATTATLPAADGTFLVGKVNYTWVNSTGTLRPTVSSGPGVGVLFVEQKDVLNVRNAVYVGAQTPTADDKIQVDTGGITLTDATASFSTWDSDTYKSSAVDFFGTVVTKNSRDQDTATLAYPIEQMSNEIYILGADGAVSTQEAVVGETLKKASSVKTAVAKLDGDVTTADKNNDNIILVGGPAVNDLVADLAAEGKTKDVNWYYDEGQGTAIIDLVEDAWGTGKAALVVAGHSWGDTKTVTNILLDYGSHASELTGSFVKFKNGVLTTESAE